MAAKEPQGCALKLNEIHIYSACSIAAMQIIFTQLFVS
jgi:hypothetical protein